MVPTPFTQSADTISDLIIDMANHRIEAAALTDDQTVMLQLLAGQLLALKSLLNVMGDNRPTLILTLDKIVDETLRQVLAYSEARLTQSETRH